MEAVSVLLEKAVVVPVTEASTLVPSVSAVGLVPGLVGHRGIHGLAIESPSGTKRRLSVHREAGGRWRRRQTPTGNQLPPTLYSQVPLPEVRPVTATPSSGTRCPRRAMEPPTEECRHRVTGVPGLVLGDGGEGRA